KEHAGVDPSSAIGPGCSAGASTIFVQSPTDLSAIALPLMIEIEDGSAPEVLEIASITKSGNQYTLTLNGATSRPHAAGTLIKILDVAPGPARALTSDAAAS